MVSRCKTVLLSIDRKDPDKNDMCDTKPLPFLLISVNSVCFAPHELGLILACGSSDGSISVLYNTGEKMFLLTFYIRMDFPIHIDTISIGMPIVY